MGQVTQVSLGWGRSSWVGWDRKRGGCAKAHTQELSGPRSVFYPSTFQNLELREGSGCSER